MSEPLYTQTFFLSLFFQDFFILFIKLQMIRNNWHEKILITGGAGFIGSRLWEKLFDKGYDITILDNLSPQIHANGESFLVNRIKDKCIFIHGDVRYRKDWKKVIKGHDVIVQHLSAEISQANEHVSIKKYSLDVNVLGTSHML